LKVDLERKSKQDAKSIQEDVEMSLVQLKRDMDNKLKDRRASLQQEYELKLQRERDKLSKKVGVENLQEMKL